MALRNKSLKSSLTCLGLAYLLATGGVFAEESPPTESPFGWQFESVPKRGGTSRGEPVQLDLQASPSWNQIQQAGISKEERDRRAILAMAGEYRTSFEFVEVAGFTPNYKPPAVYRSWGTEKVYVTEQTPNRIVLQHVLVMKVADKEPVVVKHWRQDWTLEPESVLAYRGNDVWSVVGVPSEKRKGVWSQAVYEVDDSPRYGGLGVWVHEGGVSSWQSDTSWRPLPRREFTVREDYQALSGVNRHIINPTGWTHEQENNKAVIDSQGQLTKILAREIGLNRYERIKDFDFSSGDKYWKASEPFWASLQKEWSERLVVGQDLKLIPRKERSKLMHQAFEKAEAFQQTSSNSGDQIDALVDGYFVDGKANPK